MNRRLLESSVCDLILIGLDSLYKGKIVKISFQSFKNSMQMLKLKDYDFDEFEAEIVGFMGNEAGEFFVKVEVISRLWYTDNEEDYNAGRWLEKPIKDWLFPIEKIGNKYVCDKIQLAV